MDHDVLVVGTGLTEAVLSAALSRAGLRVLHVDANAYYGGSWACLTLSEIAAWAAAHGAELAFPREPTVPRGAPSTGTTRLHCAQRFFQPMGQ